MRLPSKLAIIILVFLLAISFQSTLLRAEQRIERPDLIAVFERSGTNGTFALYDVSKGQLTLVNASRASEQKFPASTFKIANGLIALETGVVKDENEIIPYGGRPQPIKRWEQDMSMRDAIKISNVPVYQELARRIGQKRYAKWLEQLQYGNRQTGDDVETFWLKGPLTISAIEQVEFLVKLAERKLPVSERSQSIVADIIRLEKSPAGTLYGKTGWSSSPTPDIGWFVGWVENKRGLFAFALNMDIRSNADAPLRKSIAKTLLRKLGVL